MTQSQNASTKQKDFTDCKVVFLGDPDVGKSSIVQRYSGKEITSDYSPTIGIDFCTKVVEKNGKTVRLYVWDTAGQERFRSLISTYLRDCDIAIVVYDINSVLSFSNLRYWFDYTQRECGDRIHTILVGNKTDLIEDRQISSESGEEYAKSFSKCSFIEVSALNNRNIDKLFDMVAVIASQQRPKVSRSNTVRIAEGTDKKEVSRSCSSSC